VRSSCTYAYGMKGDVKKDDWVKDLSFALVGSILINLRRQ
jgi:hypothetical protein